MDVIRAKSASGLQESMHSNAMTVARAYFALTKPRIAVFLLFTAYCGMIVADGKVPPLTVSVLGLIGLALSAGGSAAINMWFDRDIDAVMNRTRKRPLPAGTMKPVHALVFGLTLGAASVLLLGFLVNWLAALLSMAGFVYYAVVYTMWLKRRTPQNIVIGGGAGAFPPLVGAAAVTGHLSWMAVAMFAIIFLWTPPHFWALALYKNGDYTRAGVPMMPVVRGPRVTKRQMVVYTIVLTLSSLAVTPLLKAGVLYAIMAAALGGWFLYLNIRLLMDSDGSTTWAKRTFVGSLLYLPAVFTVMVVCSLV